VTGPRRRTRASLALAVALLAATAGCTGTLYERSATPATVPPDALEGTGFVEVNVTAVPTTVRVLPPPLPGDVTATSYVAAYARPGPNVTGNGNGTAASAAARDAETAASPASLLVVSSPSVRVAGRQANPLASLARADLALAVLDRLREANLTPPGPAGRLDLGVEGDLRAVGEREATLLGSRTTATVYAADARPHVGGNRTGDGTGTETATGAGATDANATGAGVRVLVATVEHGEDVVVVLGVTPRLGPSGGGESEGGDGDGDDGDAALLELVERVEHPVE
jgi:hypothetical protein